MMTAHSWRPLLRGDRARQSEYYKAFDAHFRDEYDDESPIWALTEILALGQLARLYSGLNSSIDMEQQMGVIGGQLKELLLLSLGLQQPFVELCPSVAVGRDRVADRFRNGRLAV